MQISSVQICNYNYLPRPRFKGNNRKVCNESGDLLYKTTTCFFREDLDWNDLVSLLAYKYKSTNKVNIINHSCSNGPEPFSLTAKLIQVLGSKAEKFFPIKAKDIDYNNIESAKRGRMGILLNELYKINRNLNNNINTYFAYGKSQNPQNDLVLIPKPNIKDKVIFSQSDIFEDVNTMPGENTVLLCRNFWPYLTPEKRTMLAQKLSEKLNKTSLVVIGHFDDGSNIGSLLEKHGFTSAGVGRVYTKP